MKVAIGADHGGYELKEQMKQVLSDLDVSYEDYGCYSADSVDYPDFAEKVCDAVTQGEAVRGILVCGTGIGMCITANKVRGIRAALVHDTFSAKATREHNDSNVLCMGARVIGRGLAEEIVRTWLGTDFTGGRHSKRIAKIKAIEEKLPVNRSEAGSGGCTIS